MTNKTMVLLSLITFWVFVPIFMMYLNLSGFNQLDVEIVNRMNGEDFNLITLTGFADALNFIISLGKFTVTSLHALWIAFFTLLSLISIVIVVLVARGGGS